ncbi:hypothetical protein [Asticcacaulis benevestitus]|uniref:Uncharacterized protein n=1 Tax=Asticcacaulis benevestitus DSM 16100 = ATCC BAA-896 TaxID=1121022 RepID=V4PTJ7_9CAUL|nr:hypothetical protein [Asticcacaulis benevestitus]ESQ90679.1 hypothetical protein ABENE_11960 [Asticcacaulis benevestitus DSM 16100 = ATCC BAA-896]
MTILILKSLLLLLSAFLVSAWLGWTIARRARSEYSAFERPRAVFDDEPLMPVADSTPEPAPAPQPVAYLDAAAEAFTSGVVVPFGGKPLGDKPLADKAPYAPPHNSARLDLVAASHVPGNVQIRRFDNSLQRRISSLASMTPESIEAAVQQAGSGLEPSRVGVPQTAPDDLTVISGIDAGKQSELNALGIYYYWQLAGWSPENVAWMSSRIQSPQRMVRENWMAQAARLGGLN